MEADERPLMELFAGVIAERAAAEKKAAALFADRLNARVLAALISLGRSFRIVAFVSPSGADTGRALIRRLGLSVLLNPPLRQLAGADVAVFFDPPREPISLADKTVAVACGPQTLVGVSYTRAVTGVGIELPDDLADRIPPTFSREKLVSAAIQCLSLDPAEICLRSLRFDCHADRMRRRMT
jgi:hypothetical protein